MTRVRATFSALADYILDSFIVAVFERTVMSQSVRQSHAAFNPTSYLNSTVGYILLNVELSQLHNVKLIKHIFKTVYFLDK